MARTLRGDRRRTRGLMLLGLLVLVTWQGNMLGMTRFSTLGASVATGVAMIPAIRLMLSLSLSMTFWATLYWACFRGIQLVSSAVEGNQVLEVITFVSFALLPLMVAQMGLVGAACDKPLTSFKDMVTKLGSKHVIECTRGPLRRSTKALLYFMSTNFLVNALPASFSYELPEKAVFLDPNKDGKFTAQEIESVVALVSSRVLFVALALSAAQIVFGVLQKPADFDQDADHPIEHFWRGYAHRHPLAVLFYMAIAGLTLASTAAVCLHSCGFSPMAILSLGSLGGLAFGLASKDLVGNFIAGMFLMINQPFKVKDRIQVGSTCGVVHEIGFFTTKLQLDDRTVTLPNASIHGSAINNFDEDVHRAFLVTVDAVKFPADNFDKVFQEVRKELPQILLNTDIPKKGKIAQDHCPTVLMPNCNHLGAQILVAVKVENSTEPRLGGGIEIETVLKRAVISFLLDKGCSVGICK